MPPQVIEAMAALKQAAAEVPGSIRVLGFRVYGLYRGYRVYIGDILG